MVETICFAIESSHCFSLHKNFFTRDFAKLGSENKRCFCFTKTFSMYVNYCKFNLWMLKGIYDILALVINFLDENWQPKKVTIGLFETTKTTGQALVKILKKLLDSYYLRKQIKVDVRLSVSLLASFVLHKNPKTTLVQ
jgi:hypothetical protein